MQIVAFIFIAMSIVSNHVTESNQNYHRSQNRDRDNNYQEDPESGFWGIVRRFGWFPDKELGNLPPFDRPYSRSEFPAFYEGPSYHDYEEEPNESVPHYSRNQPISDRQSDRYKPSRGRTKNYYQREREPDNRKYRDHRRHDRPDTNHYYYSQDNLYDSNRHRSHDHYEQPNHNRYDHINPRNPYGNDQFKLPNYDSRSREKSYRKQHWSNSDNRDDKIDPNIRESEPQEYYYQNRNSNSNKIYTNPSRSRKRYPSDPKLENSGISRDTQDVEETSTENRDFETTRKNHGNFGRCEAETCRYHESRENPDGYFSENIMVKYRQLGNYPDY